MIFAMHRPIVLGLLVGFLLAAAALLMEIGYAETPSEIMSRRGIILLALNALILLLCWRPALKAIHWATFASKWWFPWLDGEWQAEIRSNWPKVKAMYESARGKGPRYDALTAPAPDDEKTLTLASVSIKTTLLEITIEIVPEGTHKISRTRFVRPRWAKPDRPELSYVYEQEDHTTPAHLDAQLHFGAGVIKYFENSDQIAGEYWTNRRGDVGLNTAGTIIMRRVK